MTNSCDVTGHHLRLKELIYTAKKCSLCEKRCLFRTRKMIKCIACKCVMHKKCYLAAVVAVRRVPIAASSSETMAQVITDLATVHRSPRVPSANVADSGSQAAGDSGISPAVLITEYTLLRENDRKRTVDVLMKVELKMREAHHEAAVVKVMTMDLWDELMGLAIANRSSKSSKKDGRRKT